MGRSESLKDKRGGDVGKRAGRMVQAGNLKHRRTHVVQGAFGQSAWTSGCRPTERRLGLEEASSRAIDGTGPGTAPGMGTGNGRTTATVRTAAAGPTARSAGAAAGEVELVLSLMVLEEEIRKGWRGRLLGQLARNWKKAV